MPDYNQSQIQANLRELWNNMKRQGHFGRYTDYDNYLATRAKPKGKETNKHPEQDVMVEAITTAK